MPPIILLSANVKPITEIILAVITLAFRMFVLNLSIKALLAASVLTSITSALISPAFISGPLVKAFALSASKFVNPSCTAKESFVTISISAYPSDVWSKTVA